MDRHTVGMRISRALPLARVLYLGRSSSNASPEDGHDRDEQREIVQARHRVFRLGTRRSPDKLFAIVGVASLFSETTRDEYIAGSRKSRLLESLNWRAHLDLVQTRAGGTVGSAKPYALMSIQWCPFSYSYRLSSQMSHSDSLSLTVSLGDDYPTALVLVSIKDTWRYLVVGDLRPWRELAIVLSHRGEFQMGLHRRWAVW